MVNDFLFELGCEELPSAMVTTLSESLAQQVSQNLDALKISYKNIKSFATPRRLAFLISDLNATQQPQEITRRGPALTAAYDADKKPTMALLGFLKSCNISIEQLSVEETDKGSWVTFQTVSAGLTTIALLPQIIAKALTALPIAKSMRWGDSNISFARPVHWAVMMYGNETVQACVLGLQTGNITYGHRFHHPEAIIINNAKSYEDLVKNAYVIADPLKRRAIIVEQINTCAKYHQAHALMPDSLIDEVNAIVEWPHALTVAFDDEFLAVPPEALIAAMQNHQKCFALHNAKGEILPFFITVANIDGRNEKQVIAGNARVMRARLSDAAFFFAQDKKKPLINNLELTKKVVFQNKLGSLFDKTIRVKQLITNCLQTKLSLQSSVISRACDLSRCDLMTGMVGEFPELQGLMGFYYAKLGGEDLNVAVALEEQYFPRFAADKLPSSSLGLALSLADRVDTLVGIFAIGEKPKADKDPFKLRRHALAVIRLLIAAKTDFSLNNLIKTSVSIYEAQVPAVKTIAVELQEFILERLNAYYASQSITADFVSAVKDKQNDDLYDFDLRVHALKEFSSHPTAIILNQISKRVSNILAKSTVIEQSIAEDLLIEPAEQNLFKQIIAAEQEQKILGTSQEYPAALSHLIDLKDVIDTFFAEVLVMAEDKDIQNNRLNLLMRLQVLLQNIANLAKLDLSN